MTDFSKLIRRSKRYNLISRIWKTCEEQGLGNSVLGQFSDKPWNDSATILLLADYINKKNNSSRRQNDS